MGAPKTIPCLEANRDVISFCKKLWTSIANLSTCKTPSSLMTMQLQIVDDLFAFVIKMPTLHRLSVFRDDLVFCVYIYQRWVYKVDKRRANEFGSVRSPLPSSILTRPA